MLTQDAYGQLTQGDAWKRQAIVDIVAGQTVAWTTRLQANGDLLTLEQSLGPNAAAAIIDRPDDVSPMQRRADAQDLRSHFQAGKRLGPWPFRATVVRPTSHVRKDSRIDGRLCNTEDSLSHLIDALSLTFTLESTLDKWHDDLVAKSAACDLKLNVLRSCRDNLNRILPLGETTTEIRRALKAAKIGTGSIDEVEGAKIAAGIKGILKAVQAARLLQVKDAAEQDVVEFVDCVSSVANSGHEVGLVRKLEQAAMDRNVETYEQCRSDLVTLHEKQETARRCRVLFERIGSVRQASRELLCRLHILSREAN